MGLDRDLLCTSPMLVGLTADEFDALLGIGQVGQWSARGRIVTEGTPSDALFILLRGSVQVEKEAAGRRPVVLAVLQQPGDCFGEMSLIDIQPRSAHICAREDVELLALPKKQLTALFGQFPRIQMTIILNIARNLSLRLREADERIVALSRPAQGRTGG
jgi:CRP/FNR family transcriptional regulator, cyclic AMP receptor protein